MAGNRESDEVVLESCVPSHIEGPQADPADEMDLDDGSESGAIE